MLTSECKTLLDICRPEIYRRNAFRLLGADVDITGRRIKRNEAELQSALEVGELEDEYSSYLRPDPLPTREELLQAGRVLADAKQRFVHEFFWFWPLKWGESRSDEVLKLIKAGKVTKAQKQWEKTATADDEASLTAKHNLAILGHWKALDREWEALASANNGGLTAEKRKQLNRYWRFAFKYWESLCANEAFWSIQANRIRALDDPRLTTGFLRRFAQWLPIAFDNINADLAVAYSDKGMYDRARDHIQIMEATNAGNDDVDTSLRRVTEPLNGRIDHAIETATFQLQNNKTEGKQRCTELFNTVCSILEVLEVLLGKDSQEFIETCDRVAGSMLQCQVAYGNETQDWHGSLLLLETTLKIARGTRTRTRIEENIRIVRQNKQADTCWFCERCPREEKHNIKVTLKRSITWGAIKRNPEEYREAVAEIVKQLMSELPRIGCNQLNATRMGFFSDILSALEAGDLHGIVRALDTIMNDYAEIMSQQVTTTVPRCHTCAAVHAGEKLETVGALKRKLKAAGAAVERAASTIESLKKDIVVRSQAQDNGGFIRRWVLSSKLKSLHRKEVDWKQRYDNAVKERTRLQSQLKEREEIGEVKNHQHLNSWPGIVQAKKDGFRIV